MKTHRDLDVWKKAIDLVTLVYKITKGFPAYELYGLTSQLRRSAISIPSNISEGAARNTAKDFNHFLAISLGSIAELETQAIVSKNLEYLNEQDFELLISELESVRRMTHGLKKSLKI
ncbi:MAG: four helix bundle protein [Saprospiraceae bacterium]